MSFNLKPKKQQPQHQTDGQSEYFAIKEFKSLDKQKQPVDSINSTKFDTCLGKSHYL